MAGVGGPVRLHVVRGPARAFDRLKLDEALFRDPLKRNWLVLDSVEYAQTSVILGISGKVDLLVHEPEARSNGVELMRRFTGGGTVVVDRNAFLISIISNASALSSSSSSSHRVKPFPRDIMQWSADAIYTPAFAKASGYSSSTTSQLTFRENDYVVRGEIKIAGNAQAISGDRFCHHTSFLWRVDALAMSYLKHPDKAPEYRAGRRHLDFLGGLEGEVASRREFERHVLHQLQANLAVDELVMVNEGGEGEGDLLPPLVDPSRNRLL